MRSKTKCRLTVLAISAGIFLMASSAFSIEAPLPVKTFSVKSRSAVIEISKVDFDNERSALKIVTFIAPDGFHYGAWEGAKEVCRDIYQNGTNYCHMECSYKVEVVSQQSELPLVALKGRREIKKVTAIAPDFSGSDAKFGPFTRVIDGGATLFSGDQTLFTFEGEYNDSKADPICSFDMDGVPHYLVRIGLKWQDSIGLLMWEKDQWGFNYRPFDVWNEH